MGKATPWTRIELNPRVVLGKPVVRGTRLTVEHLLELLGQGMTNEEIIQEYPQLDEQDIFAVLEYAQRRVSEERVYALGLERVPA